jgi:uncharacterized protein (DUF362 family)/Pyruvate/2-oxoacid:ferredoxin oxidoreductase delta subunit
MAKVAVIRCESYDYDKVKDAVEKGIGLIGGPGMFVRKGEMILLKPNLLSADPPEKCSTTHPAVFKAVGEVFNNFGVVLSYGDSPATHSMEAAAKKSGIAAVAEELQIKAANFYDGEDVSFLEGVQNKKFFIAKGVLESSGLISIAKLKTHGLTKMTGAVKNQFGCIPGKLKGEFHVRLPEVNDFAKMLVDLNRLLKPRLYIMDGIIAMEGNGPRGGNPKKMNVLLFSSDPIALDSTVCRIVKLDPEYVPTIRYGREFGLGTYHEEEIEIVGDTINGFIDESYNVVRKPLKPFKPAKFLRYVSNILVPRPVIDHSKCVKCGICVNMCPVSPKAVDWRNGDKKQPPSHKYKQCIRCYCCQELCPESAITLKIPYARRIFENK